MNLLEKYNKVLQSKGYIQITSDELHLNSIAEYKLRLYNRHMGKSKTVRLDFTLAEKLTKLRKLYADEQNNEIAEIIPLLELKQIFEANAVREGEISNKRNFIKDELEKLNPSFKLKFLKSDIIYDENRILFKRIDSLVKFTKELEKYKLLHTNVYFRGQQNLNWSVLPSIFRGNWITYERDFVHEMLISNPQDFVNLSTTLEKLTKMQHYNAPTRLLDLTSNPYIALYFACEKEKYSSDYDGEVLFFQSKEPEKYFDSDTVSIVSNLAMMKSDFFTGDETLDVDAFNDTNINTDSHIPYLLHQIKCEKPNFLNIINSDDLHKCFVVHVPYDNKRIMNQQGLFLIVGMGDTKTEPASLEDSVFKTDDRKLIFLIPDSQKQKILDELDTMNINKRFIYPEIDDVADYLKNQKYRI